MVLTCALCLALGVVCGFVLIEILRARILRHARQAEASFSQLLCGALHASHVDIAIVDESGTILFVNEAWLWLKDNCDCDSSAGLIGCNYFDIVAAAENIDPAIVEMTALGIRSVLAGKSEHFEVEYPIFRNDEEVWYRLNANRFRQAVPTRVVISQENITERRVAQQKLLNKQEKLRSIYHASSDGILLINSQGIFDCNDKAVKLLGARQGSELHGKQLWEVSKFPNSVQSDSATKIQQFFQLVRQTGEARCDVSLGKIDGTEFPAEVMLTTFLYDEQLVVQATFRDISERRLAEQRLQNLNQRLQEDLEAITEAERQIRETTAYLDVYRKIVDTHAIVAETDTTGTIVNVNEAFCRISGYTREELIGQNHRLLNSGLHSREMWREMYRTVANGGIWHGEICNRAKSGQQYWVDTTIAPLYNDTGKLRGYFAIRADITSLKAARAQAEAASRSKSEFLANMSHEIRTPMTAILGYADLLAELGTCDNCQLSPQASAAIETIKRNGEHLLAIINDILDISKIEAAKMTIETVPTETLVLVKDVLATMQVKSQSKGLGLRCELATAVPRYIITDPTRLRQILVNLIGNAVKFTQAGEVIVKLAYNPAQPNMLTMSIVDSGIGMTHEQTDRLFQAFEQADSSMTRRFGGTGLGLLISKRLAQMLGGDISVDSHPGIGSTFTLTIGIGSLDSSMMDNLNGNGLSPIGLAIGGSNASSCDLPSSDQPIPAGAITVAPGNYAFGPSSSSSTIVTKKASTKQLEGVRILLVEDGPDNQRLILHHLKKAGATVQLACNGKLAVEAMTVDANVEGELIDPSPFDLVLMDMQMPVMDGREATQLLRRKGATLPILAITAHAMQADLQMCLDAGCDARITKPIDRAQMIETVRSHFSRASIGRSVPLALGVESVMAATSVTPASV